jgi:predicted nucleic acid-binding protein
MKYLLDVNMLLAAIWTTHESHKKAIAWIEGKSLASCAITEIGFLRTSTHPKALNSDMTSAH